MCKRHYNAENRRVNGRTDQRVSVPCTHCGAPVEKYASDAKRQRPFCDYTCRDLHRIENPYRYSGNGRVKGIAEPIPASHPARWYGARVDIAYTPCAACDRLMTHATYTEKRYCSVACRRAVARKRRGPRGYRKHAALVYERDDFTCWICDEPVDLTVKAPHPRSATLDHIIPRSLGGTNDPDNLGTAHFICNCRRGASMTLRDRAA
jgi:5-methylcytosine-specific restriction endonuclease McrA